MPGTSRDESMDDDPRWQRYAKRALEELLPMVDESTFCIALVPRKPEDYDDIKFCIELGMMIMLNKPILLVVPPGTKLPDKLALIADSIVELDQMDPDFQDRLTAEIGRITKDLQDGNGQESP